MTDDIEKVLKRYEELRSADHEGPRKRNVYCSLEGNVERLKNWKPLGVNTTSADGTSNSFNGEQARFSLLLA